MRAELRYVMFISMLVCIFALAMGNYSSHANVREEFGLVSLWTFDEDTVNGNEVDDAFGENNGAITGNAKSVQGSIGNALSFDGVVDLVRIANDIFFESVTVEAIINPTLGTRNPIYDKYNYGIQLVDSNQVGIWIRADTEVRNQWPSAYTPFPADGAWHHVVGVVESEVAVRIYLDGTLKGSTDAPDAISIAYGAQVKPSIAYTQHMGGIWYEGEIDEVAVYEGALSDNDVARLYVNSFAVEPTGKMTSAWGTLKQ